MVEHDPVFELHRGGKMAVQSTVPLSSREDLSMAYTPGVARVCEAIADDPTLAREYTWTGHTVAVVTDGSAVLGLGNIGPRAAMPVMEGKAVLFKQFGGVDAVPVCLDTQDTDEIIRVVTALAPSFGGINLEDIAAPRCFEIERRLDAALDIPVFHDDQHGTAIVVLAALRNAAALLDRKLEELRIVISGAGAAGVAVSRMLLAGGAHDIVVCDSRGIVHSGRNDLNSEKDAIAGVTNPRRLTGAIVDALQGADVLIGVSGGTIDEAAVAAMAPGGAIFALANPNPEVAPDHRCSVRRRGSHRSQRLPQPDQQCARLPRSVPGCPRRRCHHDHRADEDCRRGGHRRRRRRRGHPRRHRAVAAGPEGSPGRGVRGRRRLGPFRLILYVGPIRPDPVRGAYPA